MTEKEEKKVIAAAEWILAFGWGLSIVVVLGGILAVVSQCARQ